MLVLSRHPNEIICIGTDIFIHVNEIRGDKVRLGIVAPENVKILRKELCGSELQIKANKAFDQ